ncbi:MAG: glycosyltransferase family 4 protein, partial [Chloroflexi bacterium]|nr:glycosyltransferase family 4 protein [Chloroflexota bacterium]
AEQCRTTKARVVEYDFDEIASQSHADHLNWIDALQDCDVAVCTVHPPRDEFHASVFAGRCIQDGDLQTYLITKTGTIVPEYLREYYLPKGFSRVSIVAISDYTRRFLMDTYDIPQEKVTLIYQGIDLQRFNPNKDGKTVSSRRYPLPNQAEPVLGCIGSMETRKGHAYLLEALAALAADHLPNIYLLLVGDGPEEHQIRRMVKDLELENRVVFFPFTAEPELAFEQVDITVLPSVAKEGLPNVLQESLAMKVPVVASDLGGVSEVVLDGQTGLLVKPGDVAELASAIDTLWSNQVNCQKMGDDGHRLVESKFDRMSQFDKFRVHLQSYIGAKEQVPDSKDDNLLQQWNEAI